VTRGSVLKAEGRKIQTARKENPRNGKENPRNGKENPNFLFPQIELFQ
jgi:hypothetical protein